MKYTLEQLRTDKNIIIYLTSEKEWQTLKDLKLFNMTTEYCGAYCYSLIGGTYSGISTREYTGGYSSSSVIVEFSDIDFSPQSKLD
jgi:hypothetical protein